MMWMVIAREPRPDAPYWPGRRWLALADAVGWPLALVTALAIAPVNAGVVLPVAGGLLLLNAIVRAHTALAANQRYWFTTWRLAKVLAVLIVIAIALKVATSWR